MRAKLIILSAKHCIRNRQAQTRHSSINAHYVSLVTIFQPGEDWRVAERPQLSPNFRRSSTGLKHQIEKLGQL
jgi:hypothetical protein